MKTLLLWPRDEDYYHRGIGWAGKIRTADGQLIYDSVLSNATGHYLHNMLFVMGADGQSAMPERIEAQLWRANSIENFDTAKVDMTFTGGMQAHCLVSHAVAQQLNPIFMYRFEGATVFYAQSCDEHSAALTPEWYDQYDHILACTDEGAFTTTARPLPTQAGS